MANVTKELVLNETFMSTEQTPRNVADILADELENIASAIEGGSGSGGHIIQNAAGTDLAQEAKLQFGGMLKTTDDATNGVTKVSDLAEEVEWSVWNAMTEAERTAYSAGKKLDIINIPSVSGSVPVELMKKLWTNPNPSASFAEQTITLSSDDYDSLLILTNYSTNVLLEFSNIIEKTSAGCVIEYSFAYNNIERQLTREIRKVSDTSFSIKNNSYFKGSQTDVENDYLIPLAIYGIKSSVNVDMSALVANVSTEASKCMLSDGETSVEDAFNTLKGFSLVTETDSIAINGVVNVNLSDVDISKVVEFGVMVSYNGAFGYASFNTLPVIGNVRLRLYHYINSASFGTVQCLIYLSGSDYYMEIASQVNEAIKVRLYARYI